MIRDLSLILSSVCAFPLFLGTGPSVEVVKKCQQLAILLATSVVVPFTSAIYFLTSSFYLNFFDALIVETVGGT